MSFTVHIKKCALELHFTMPWRPSFVYKSLDCKYLLDEGRRKFNCGESCCIAMSSALWWIAINDGEDKRAK